jgi:hypothetical protein
VYTPLFWCAQLVLGRLAASSKHADAEAPDDVIAGAAAPDKPDQVDVLEHQHHQERLSPPAGSVQCQDFYCSFDLEVS